MCNCLTEIDLRIQKDEPNLRIDTATAWSQKTNKINTVPKMTASKIDKSIRKGSKGMTIFPAYCPFCGVKIDLHEVESECN